MTSLLLTCFWLGTTTDENANDPSDNDAQGNKENGEHRRHATP